MRSSRAESSASKPSRLISAEYSERRSASSLKSAMRPIDVPTQVLWGTNDNYLQLDYASPPSRWVWDVRVEKLEGYSHWVQVDAAAEVNKRLLGFLPPP